MKTVLTKINKSRFACTMYVPSFTQYISNMDHFGFVSHDRLVNVSLYEIGEIMDLGSNIGRLTKLRLAYRDDFNLSHNTQILCVLLRSKKDSFAQWRIERAFIANFLDSVWHQVTVDKSMHITKEDLIRKSVKGSPDVWSLPYGHGITKKHFELEEG